MYWSLMFYSFWRIAQLLRYLLMTDVWKKKTSVSHVFLVLNGKSTHIVQSFSQSQPCIEALELSSLYNDDLVHIHACRHCPLKQTHTRTKSWTLINFRLKWFTPKALNVCHYIFPTGCFHWLTQLCSIYKFCETFLSDISFSYQWPAFISAF